MKKQLVFLIASLVVCMTAHTTVSAQGGRAFNKPTGYMGIVELSAGGSINGWAGAPVSATIVNGYRFSPQFAIGVGTGVQMIMEESVIPVFLHLRSDILDNWVSPYVAFNVGWNFPMSYYPMEGLMAEPSIGVGFNAGDRSRLTIGAFCAINQIRIYENPTLMEGNYQAANNCFMGLKVGMSF